MTFQSEILVDVPEGLAVQIRNKYDPEVVARFDAAPDKTFPLLLKEFTTEADPHTRHIRRSWLCLDLKT